MVVHHSAPEGRNQGELYGLEYLELSTRERERMSKAMVQLQLRLISSHVELA